MSKAILVMDMPECCADCPCSFFERSNSKLNLICGIVQEDANNVGKPDWCPLRPMPEKETEPTIAWMPDQEEQPEPYIGCDVEVVQLVRSTDFYDDYLYDEQVSKTNADRIRSMSDEELAMCMMCPNENGLAEINCDHSDNCNCYGCILRWLRSEVEE